MLSTSAAVSLLLAVAAPHVAHAQSCTDAASFGISGSFGEVSCATALSLAISGGAGTTEGEACGNFLAVLTLEDLSTSFGDESLGGYTFPAGFDTTTNLDTRYATELCCATCAAAGYTTVTEDTAAFRYDFYSDGACTNLLTSQTFTTGECSMLNDDAEQLLTGGFPYAVGPTVVGGSIFQCSGATTSACESYFADLVTNTQGDEPPCSTSFPNFCIDLGGSSLMISIAGDDNGGGGGGGGGGDEEDDDDDKDDDPCFPSAAKVTLADGSFSRIDQLKEGDAIAAVDAEGKLTTDTVSLLSIAKPEATASFVVLTTAANATLTLTPAHHLPVGEACCSELKLAKNVIVGDKVWAADLSAKTAAATTITSKTTTTAAGLHSPVLTHGSFPVVDGLVTAFDAIEKMMLAKQGLPALLAACKATGTCTSFKDLFLGEDLKYVTA